LLKNKSSFKTMELEDILISKKINSDQAMKLAVNA